MKTLGQKIRELREAKDLSLRELARELEVSAAFLSDVELDRRNLSDKHLSKLAEALNVSMKDFGKNDTRPPINDLRRMAISNPEFGFAFRKIIDEKISSKELIDFINNRTTQKKKK